MKRTDMDKTVLYAITGSHYNPRPGYVLDPGKNPGKVQVRRYWRWPGSDDDFLNPTPQVLGLTVKYDDDMVTTADVLEPWADYCNRIKAERMAAFQARLDADAAHEAEKQAELARVEALRPLVPGKEASSLYCELDDIAYMIKSDRGSDQRYTARHVLALLEAVASKAREALVAEATKVQELRHDDQFVGGQTLAELVLDYFAVKVA